MTLAPQLNDVRPAAVAGTFYPSDPLVLARDVDTLLARATVRDEKIPKAIVCPHAGYVYSGPIAATAFKAVAAGAKHIHRVVLLGPAHRVAFAGMALPAANSFQTPLGRVPLEMDHPALNALPRSEAAHRAEHSLEVELPFLQRLLPPFRLVPLLVGRATPESVGTVLEQLWGGSETLILVSSDLSHYEPYEIARQLDTDTARHVLAYDLEDVIPERACGAAPLNGLLWVARRKQLRARLLDLRNSGDTAGSDDAVVGYGAFAFYE